MQPVECIVSGAPYQTILHAFITILIHQPWQTMSSVELTLCSGWNMFASFSSSEWKVTHMGVVVRCPHTSGNIVYDQSFLH